MNNGLARLWRKLFTLEQWRIGVANVSVAEFLLNPKAVDFEWTGGDRLATVLADPFGIEINGALTIFAEQLIYGRTKGQLVQLGAPGGAALCASPHHLSYPFTLCENGTVFVLPEQAQSGRVEIYPYTKNELGPARILIADLDAIDPTLLKFEGRWWLFCTRLSDRPNEALHLYFADALIGPYTPHPQNPVVIDKARARPGGRIITQNGKLLRPGQDCSQTYGGAISLNEIELMTPTEYRERSARRITPDMIKGAWADGLHTLEHTQNHVLIDTKRFAFHPFAWALKLSDRFAGRTV